VAAIADQLAFQQRDAPRRVLLRAKFTLRAIREKALVFKNSFVQHILHPGSQWEYHTTKPDKFLTANKKACPDDSAPSITAQRNSSCDACEDSSKTGDSGRDVPVQRRRAALAVPRYHGNHPLAPEPE